MADLDLAAIKQRYQQWRYGWRSLLPDSVAMLDEIERLRAERDEARELAKRFMVERNEAVGAVVERNNLAQNFATLTLQAVELRAERDRLRDGIRQHRERDRSIAEAIGSGRTAPHDEELWALLDDTEEARRG